MYNSIPSPFKDNANTCFAWAFKINQILYRYAMLLLTQYCKNSKMILIL